MLLDRLIVSGFWFKTLNKFFFKQLFIVETKKKHFEFFLN